MRLSQLSISIGAYHINYKQLRHFCIQFTFITWFALTVSIYYRVCSNWTFWFASSTFIGSVNLQSGSLYMTQYRRWNSEMRVIQHFEKFEFCIAPLPSKLQLLSLVGWIIMTIGRISRVYSSPNKGMGQCRTHISRNVEIAHTRFRNFSDA